MTKQGTDALLVIGDGLFFGQRARIAELAARGRLPTIFMGREHAEDGGLMAYGPDFRDNVRRAATFVDKILKGVKPGDLLIEQPTKFELVVNRASRES
jgi:putative ABC transport system substrate-binding protein